MNIKNIKALADILNAQGLSAIEVGEGENHIRIEKNAPAVSMPAQPVLMPSQVQSASQADETTVTPMAPETPDTTSGTMEHSVDFNRLIEVKSPIVGVYYAAPSPDAESFVRIGSKVSKGDVLCIIETMKLMNEITAEQDGEIVDICVKNGDIAEFGQVLFKMTKGRNTTA